MNFDIKNIVKSNKVRVLIYITAGVLILLFVFQAGMFIGFKKASFSNKLGESYFREMNGKTNDPVMGLARSDFTNSHGATGKIIEIKLPDIVVEDNDGSDKTIYIGTSTEIRAASGAEKIEDLKLDDFVVVFGAPSDTDPTIDARLVRVLPSPTNQN